jgi:hypothetical protein
VDRSWLFSAEEDMVGSISRKGHAWYRFFENSEDVLFIDYLEKGKKKSGNIIPFF